MKKKWYLLVAGVIFLGALVVVIWPGKSSEFRRWESTNRQMHAFAYTLQSYIEANKQIPLTLNDAIHVIHNSPLKDPPASAGHYPMLEANKDAWGDPFEYKVMTDQQKITLHSKGNGDEINVTVDIIK